MTIEDAIKMLEARLKCLTRATSKINGCGFRCEDCRIDYAKGNIKEQKECLETVLLILKHRPKPRSTTESYVKGYNRCRLDMLSALSEIDNYINMDIYTDEVREIIMTLNADVHTSGGAIDVLLDHFK